MHETAVADSIIQAIVAEAEKQNARPIGAKITCGMFNALNEEVLGFAFEAIAKGTVAESVKLNIVQKPLQAKCSQCSKQFDYDLTTNACKHCESTDFKLLPDEPITLETIEFEVE